MANIHLYKDNSTDGGTDGTLVSEGDGLVPVLSGELRADLEQESSSIKLALRCDSGFQTIDNGGIHATITPIGITTTKWALAPDNAGSPGVWGAYGAMLNISTLIGAVNKIFWAKAKATADENPSNDTGVDLKIDAIIGAV